LRNALAFPLLPAALASVPFGFVLVRVRGVPPSLAASHELVSEIPAEIPRFDITVYHITSTLGKTEFLIAPRAALNPK